MKKKILALLLTAVCTMGMVAGCGGTDNSTTGTQSAAAQAGGESYTIGISQFAEHGSLDNCREGFLAGLKNAGIEEGKNLAVEYQNAQTDTGTASTIEQYKSLAGDYGFEIVDTGINTSADIEIAATDLVSKVDCLCNLTDNTVVNALQTVLDKANNAGIPVFGSEIEQVKSGCVASMGIDYYQLGIETGELAAKILKGEATTKDTNFITASKAELYVNTAAADKIGMKLDDAYIKDAAQTFDEIILSSK